VQAEGLGAKLQVKGADSTVATDTSMRPQRQDVPIRIEARQRAARASRGTITMDERRVLPRASPGHVSGLGDECGTPATYAARDPQKARNPRRKDRH